MTHAFVVTVAEPLRVFVTRNRVRGQGDVDIPQSKLGTRTHQRPFDTPERDVLPCRPRVDRVTGSGKICHHLGTKNYIKMLGALGLADKKSILVLGELNKNVYLSSRNLKNSKVVIHSELNTYSISNAHNVILSESAVAGIESLLNR